MVEYAETLKTKGETRLFPELKQRRDGFTHDVSKWFGRYQQNCGIPRGKKTDDKKDFHSFRHNVADALKQAGVPEEQAAELHGHSGGKRETYTRYAGRYTPKFLKDNVVDKIRYDVDLSHLKYSRFAQG